MIILALGNYELENKLDVFLERENGDELNAPTILVIKGIPKTFQEVSYILEETPKNYSYRGICSDHLLACDHLSELIHEIPLGLEELLALSQYESSNWSDAIRMNQRKGNLIVVNAPKNLTH